MSTYGKSGASTRVRLYDWLDHLSVDAIKEDYLGTPDNSVKRLMKRLPEVLRAETHLRGLVSSVSDATLLMSRQASPFTSGAIEERLLRAAGHGVYDFDDALMHDTGSWARRIWSKESTWRRSIQAADTVVAGSAILAEQASAFASNVVMVPSCVEPAKYVRKREYELQPIPTAVWIGSPATESLLLSLESPLLRLNRQFGLRLIIVSAGNAGLGALGSIVDRVAWSEAGFAQMLANADFGIMPLTDTPYHRGKCSYKLLQYAATGLPLVGSPVGANADALQKLGGLSAETPDHWYDACAALIEMSAAKRSELGSAAFAGVNQHFSFQAWKDEWLTAVGLRLNQPRDVRN